MKTKWSKTVIGATALLLAVAPELVDEVGKIIAAGGGDPMKFLKIAASVVTIIGLGHKVMKLAAAGESKSEPPEEMGR